MKKIVIVLGMHRTGTSLVTSILHDLGFNPGKVLLEAGPSNQEGFWEYKPLVQFHSRILEEYDNRWFAPGHLMPLDELLFQYRNEAEALVRNMDNDDSNWCWKDPRLLLFLDFWLEILAGRDVKWIITHRHPASIAASIRSRDHFDNEVGLTLWEYSIANLMVRKEKLKDTITIDYEKLLTHPKTQIERIASFLQTGWDEKIKDSYCQSALNRVKVEAAHHRNPSTQILTEQQLWLEKWVQDEKRPPGNFQIGLMTQAHRRFFRKLYRETQGMTVKKKDEYETLIVAEKQKIQDLEQVINKLQEQLEEVHSSSSKQKWLSSFLFGKYCSTKK